MFHSILIKSSFLSGDLYIEFKDGLNVLVGKNNSGKSTTIEMLNYSLFGSSALRSSISSYPKDFEVETILNFYNGIYKVNRTVKNASLYKYSPDTSDFEVVCVGITPVNLYIKTILSYDYKVFSLTNYCKQHDLLNLTSCSPKELVTLIEVISGLEESYRLMFKLRELKRDYRTEHKAFVSARRFDFNSEDTFEINEDFEKLLQQNEDVISNFKDLSVDAYNDVQKYSEQVVRLKTFSESLDALNSSISSIDRPSTSLEEIDKVLEEESEKKTELTKLENKKKIYKKPSKEYTQEYLDNQKELYEQQAAYARYLKIKKKLDDHTVTCPNCNHSFADINLELEEEFDTAPETPELAQRAILEQEQWLSNKDKFIALEVQIESLKGTFKDDKELIKLKSDKKDLEQLFKVELDLETKNKELEEYLNANIEESLRKETLEETIESVSNVLSKTKDKYQEYLTIKEDLSSYLKDKQVSMEKAELYKDLEDKIFNSEQRYLLADVLYQALLDTKQEIQTLSLPVLNSTASNLLSEVTGGERNSIEITEDFEILVDGLPVNVLEGSGKVITNLSLRIALLNTFYKDNFLVCLFDEIDESLHEDRFEYMEECFNRLTSSGYQIIAVSHKQYNSGNIINLHESVLE